MNNVEMTRVEQAQATRTPMAKAAEKVDVFYCVYREGFSSVFTAQVLVPLSQHGEDVQAQLGLFVPVGHYVRPRWRKKLLQLRQMTKETYGLKLTTLCTSPSRLRRLWNNSGQLKRWLRKHRPADRPYIVHCRNLEMTNIALDACQDDEHARVIFDCRGLEVAEYMQQRGLDGDKTNEWPAEERKLVDEMRSHYERTVRVAAQVICVSTAMQEYLVDEYGLSPSKAMVIPCCPDVDRFTVTPEQRVTTRNELGLSDKFVVTYCGSMAWYQLPQECLRGFRLIAAIEPRSHFLAITTQPNIMRDELRKAGIEESSSTVVSVSPLDVPRYLAAGDVGLLLRDESLVNRVASPVKFGEYMAAGLPVIITDHLGDYSAAVAEHELGRVIRLSDSDETISTTLREFVSANSLVSGDISDQCRRYAEAHLQWANHLPGMAVLYRQLVTGQVVSDQVVTESRS